jgi:hypothetical protein
MNVVRNTTTSRIVAIGAGLVAIGGATAAVAAGAFSGSKPPAKPLAQALADAAKAPSQVGITARITFTNNLFPSGVLGRSASPLLAGGSGRLWVTGDGRFRLEVQAPAGDAQIVGDHTGVKLYDPASNTVYTLAMSARTVDPTRKPKAAHAAPTAAGIQGMLDRLIGKAIISDATPTNVAGQPAYSVRVAPAANAGLLGSVELAWDAARGIPLRAGIYARGATQPTIELTATEISYGPINASDLAVGAPKDARVQAIDLASRVHGTAPATGKADRSAETAAQVQAKVSFTLHAPATVAGLPLTSIRAVGKPGHAGALVVYGKGLGSIVVLEQATAPAKAATPAQSGGSSSGLDLPTVSIGGASGTEFATALGTLVHVSRGGVDYTVIGSVPAIAAEAAARDAVA